MSLVVSRDGTKIDRRRGLSSSGDSISSHDDLPNSGEGDQVDGASGEDALLGMSFLFSQITRVVYSGWCLAAFCRSYIL